MRLPTLLLLGSLLLLSCNGQEPTELNATDETKTPGVREQPFRSQTSTAAGDGQNTSAHSSQHVVFKPIEQRSPARVATSGVPVLPATQVIAGPRSTKPTPKRDDPRASDEKVTAPNGHARSERSTPRDAPLSKEQLSHFEETNKKFRETIGDVFKELGRESGE